MRPRRSAAEAVRARAVRRRLCALGVLAASLAGAALAKAGRSGLQWDEAEPAPVLEEAQDLGGVRVLWWNAHGGRVLLDREDYTLSRNLAELARSGDAAPDLVALGEYTDVALRPADLAELKARYPYTVYQSYEDETFAGLMVFSRYPFKVLSADFLKGERRLDARPALILDVDAAGRELIFVPVHIFDAWRRYQAEHGKWKTGLEVGFGRDNPVYRQIQEFLADVKTRLGARYGTADVVVVGDFNQPASMFGVVTPAYRTIEREFSAAVDDPAPTFPARGTAESRSYPAMALDHAFVSPGLRVRHGRVLPLRGSNHYPLIFSVYPGARPALLAGAGRI